MNKRKVALDACLLVGIILLLATVGDMENSTVLITAFSAVRLFAAFSLIAIGTFSTIHNGA